MTDMSGQAGNLNKASKEEKNNSTKKRIKIESFLLKNAPIKFQQYPLFDCGFLRGNKSKIRFIKNKIDQEFMITPADRDHFIEDVFSKDNIKNASSWRYLYISFLDQRYVVSRPHEHRVWIQCNDHNDINKIRVDIQNCVTAEEKSVSQCYRLGKSSCVYIIGNVIKVCLHPNKSSLSNTLSWQIPIIYIMNDVIIKSSEKLMDQLVVEEGKTKHRACFFNHIFRRQSHRDKLYDDFLKLRMSFFRSNPIEKSSTIVAWDVWNILYKHFMIKESFEKCCSLVDFYQKTQHEYFMRFLSIMGFVLACIEGFKSMHELIKDCFPSLLELFELPFLVPVESVVTLFIPCTI